MNLKSLITRFRKDEDGAVTVDWVVLTAGLVILAAALGTTISNGVNESAKIISDDLIERTTTSTEAGAATTPDTTTTDTSDG